MPAAGLRAGERRIPGERPQAMLTARDLPSCDLSDHLERRLDRVLREERLQRAAMEGRHPSEVRTAEGLTGEPRGGQGGAAGLFLERLSRADATGCHASIGAWSRRLGDPLWVGGCGAWPSLQLGLRTSGEVVPALWLLPPPGPAGIASPKPILGRLSRSACGEQRRQAQRRAAAAVQPGQGRALPRGLHVQAEGTILVLCWLC